MRIGNGEIDAPCTHAARGYPAARSLTATRPTLLPNGKSDGRIGFLLDMDGVIYRGHQVIDGAATFVQRLREEAIPFLFLTNNSASSPRDYVVKLQKMGFEVEDHHFYTCAMATVDFLCRQKPRGTAFVIGEGGLVTALHQAGYGITENHPDYVIVGEGRVLNFEMAEKATMMVRGGAHLIATNLDPSCPTAAVHPLRGYPARDAERSSRSWRPPPACAPTASASPAPS